LVEKLRAQQDALSLEGIAGSHVEDNHESMLSFIYLFRGWGNKEGQKPWREDAAALQMI